MQVQKARLDMVDDVLNVLATFNNPLMSNALWRRMLFDYPWPCEEDYRGYVLTEGAKVVGFLGTIFSTRRINEKQERFCNISSWVVLPEHRSSGFQLVMPVLGLRGYTLVNLTPTDAARKIFESFRFRVFETAQLLLAPVGTPREVLRSMTGRVYTSPAKIRPLLDGEALTRFDDHQNTLARAVLVRRGQRQCLAIATLHILRRVRFAHVHYMSDPELFWSVLPLFKGGFLWSMGTPALMIDERLSAGQSLPAQLTYLRKPLHQPRMFRPAHPGITAEHVDSLYSELMGLRWDPSIVSPAAS